MPHTEMGPVTEAEAKRAAQIVWALIFLGAAAVLFWGCTSSEQKARERHAYESRLRIEAQLRARCQELGGYPYQSTWDGQWLCEFPCKAGR